MTRVGVLALQGDFEAHRRAVVEAGAEAVLARRAADLESLQGLILPGGESTTLIRLLKDLDLVESIRSLHDAGTPIFGTCAGAILLARRVSAPEQFSLGLIDLTIERNGWGRQKESFETTGAFPGGGAEASPPGGDIPLVFIRAPRIRSVGPGVRVLIEFRGEPVLVRERSVLAATFHPEMGSDRSVHMYFLKMINRAADPGERTAGPGGSAGRRPHAVGA